MVDRVVTTMRLSPEVVDLLDAIKEKKGGTSRTAVFEDLVRKYAPIELSTYESPTLKKKDKKVAE